MVLNKAYFHERMFRVFSLQILFYMQGKLDQALNVKFVLMVQSQLSMFFGVFHLQFAIQVWSTSPISMDIRILIV